jgi:hypothetical protein
LAICNIEKKQPQIAAAAWILPLNNITNDKRIVKGNLLVGRFIPQRTRDGEEFIARRARNGQELAFAGG